jgi:hypothetical protein
VRLFPPLGCLPLALLLGLPPRRRLLVLRRLFVRLVFARLVLALCCWARPIGALGVRVGVPALLDIAVFGIGGRLPVILDVLLGGLGFGSLLGLELGLFAGNLVGDILLRLEARALGSLLEQLVVVDLKKTMISKPSHDHPTYTTSI